MLAPFRMVCRDFILPEPASYVFFYAIFNLRNLLYIICGHTHHEEKIGHWDFAVLSAALSSSLESCRLNAKKSSWGSRYRKARTTEK